MTLLLVDYLRAQLEPRPLEPPQYLKHERVANFLQIPLQLEQFMVYGMLICLDGVLYNLTILPLRIFWSFIALFMRRVGLRGSSSASATTAPSSSNEDSLKGLLIVLVSWALTYVDVSRLYHSIRGQSTLKLYVIFNVSEVLDKLFSSIGLDVIDSYFSNPLSNAAVGLNPLFHFILSASYIFCHCLILLYQVITLNVAANSFSNSILTLLVSNQFMEIKSAVFKKFDRENLFQLSCADVIERFQLLLYICIIAYRNLVQFGFKLDSSELWDRLLMPLILIYTSEVLVDGLKHSFISKFNLISPSVYKYYQDSLAVDFEVRNTPSTTPHVSLDQSPVISRKIGFSTLPIGCLIIKVAFLHSPLNMYPLIFIGLFTLKCITGLVLFSWNHQIRSNLSSSSSKDKDKFNSSAESLAVSVSNPEDCSSTT